MYKIHKNVPMPEVTRGKYPFEDLGVGDMFHVPFEGENPTQEDLNQLRKRMSGAASMAGKRLGKTFSTQIVMDDGHIGVGVWRSA